MASLYLVIEIGKVNLSKNRRMRLLTPFGQAFLFSKQKALPFDNVLDFYFFTCFTFFPSFVSQWPVFSPKLFCNPYPSHCRTILLIHRLVNALNSQHKCLPQNLLPHSLSPESCTKSLSKTASTGHHRCASSFVQSTTAPRTRSWSLVTPPRFLISSFPSPFAASHRCGWTHRSQCLGSHSAIAVDETALHQGGWPETQPLLWLASPIAVAETALHQKIKSKP